MRTSQKITWRSASRPLSTQAGNAARGAWSGFTLVEVLVVVAIIAILAAIFFSVFGSVRSRARRSSCASNLQQLHKAFAMYADDNDEFIPPYQNNMHFCTLGTKDEGYCWMRIPEHGALLVEVLDPYLKSRDIWFCPEDHFAGTNSTAGWIRHEYTSYFTGKDWSEGFFHFKHRIKMDNYGGVLLTDETREYNIFGQMRRYYSHGGRYNNLFFNGQVKMLPGIEANNQPNSYAIPYMDCRNPPTTYWCS